MLSRPLTHRWWRWHVAPTVGERPHAEMLTYLYLILMASPTRAFLANYYRASMTVVSSIFFRCSGFSHVSVVGLFPLRGTDKNNCLFRRVFDGRPGEPRGERRAEEIHGCVLFTRTRSSPSQAGHHSSALQ